MKGNPEKFLAESLNAALEKFAAERIMRGRLVSTKEDLRADLDDELYRLFYKIGKYDDAIRDLRSAIRGGNTLINVVAPGYRGGHPASAIADLVIATALQEESMVAQDADEAARTADLKRRNAERRRATLQEVALESSANPNIEEKNLQAVRDAVEGQDCFDPLDPRNILANWTFGRARELAAQIRAEMSTSDTAEDPTQEEINRAAMALRKDDLVFDPSNEESYLYPCKAFNRSGDVAALEKRAQETRNRWKAGEAPPNPVREGLESMFGRLDSVLGVSEERRFAPYGLNMAEGDLSSVSLGLRLPEPTMEAVQNWVADNSRSLNLSPISRSPTPEWSDWLARNFPSQLKEWAVSLPDDEKREVVKGWRNFALVRMYVRPSLKAGEMTLPEAKAFMGKLSRDTGFAEGEQELFEGWITDTMQALGTAEAESGEGFAHVPGYDAVFRAIVSENDIPEDQFAQARAMATEFVGGRFRSSVQKNMQHSNEPLDFRSSERLTPGESAYIAVPLRRLAEALNVDPNHRVSDLRESFSNSVGSFAVQHGDRTFAIPINTSGPQGGIRINQPDAQRIANIDMSETGAVVVDVPPDAPQLEGDSYTLSIEGGGFAGSLYSAEYGDNFSDTARRLQAAHNVSVNRGPLPNWAPAPYDYRAGSSHSVGNANNLFEIQLALQKRLRLRDTYRKKREIDSGRASMYACALDRLDSEISEIRQFLEWIQADPPRGLGLVPEERLSLESASRYLERNSEEFYVDVKNRAEAKGVSLPVFNKFVNTDVLQQVLPEEEFEKIREVYDEASVDWGREGRETGRSVVVIKGLDDVSTTHGNGIWETLTREEEEEQRGLNPKFVETISRFYESASAGGNSKSHVIVVTDVVMRKGQFAGVSIPTVHVNVSNVDGDEIEQYLAFFEDKFSQMEAAQIRGLFPRDRAVEKISDEDLSRLAGKFFVPSSFGYQFVDGLAGLDLVKTRTYLEDSVQQLFHDFLVTNGNVSGVISANEMRFREEIRDRQADNQTAKELTITSRIPAVRVADYRRRYGSEWADFIDTRIAPAIDTTKMYDQQRSLVLRLLDIGVLFVSVSEHKTRVDDADSDVAFRVTPTVKFDAKPVGNTYWIRTDTDELVSAVPDEATVKMATAVFSVTPGDIADWPSEVQLNPGEEIVPRLSRKHVDECVRQANVLISSLNTKAAQMRRDVVEPITLCWGEAGSGKTIYGQMLAKEFGLRYQEIKLEELYGTGSANWRGGSEQNLSKFVAYCRTLKNTVLVIDEFHKPFVPDPSGQGGVAGAEMANLITSMLQTAWSAGGDLSTYIKNNFFIVLTSNASPNEMAERAGTLLDRVKGEHYIPVASDIRDLREYLGAGGASQMLLEELQGSNTQIARTLIAADEAQDDELFEATALKMIAADKQVFTKSLIRPEEARRQFMESQGFKTEVMTPMEQARDFVAGWKYIKKIFADMDHPVETRYEDPETGEVRTAEMSPLEAGALKLERAMQFVPEEQPVLRERETMEEIGRLPWAAAGYRALNRMLTEMLKEHQDFLRGDSGALPLNELTFYLSASLTSWMRTPEEVARRRHRDRRINDLANRLESERGGAGVNGWQDLRAIVNSHVAENSGIGPQTFMTKKDIDYVWNTSRDAVVENPSYKQDMEAGVKPGVQQLATLVLDLLLKRDGSFDGKLLQIKALIENWGDANSANTSYFLDQLMKIRVQLFEAVQRYTEASTTTAEVTDPEKIEAKNLLGDALVEKLLSLEAAVVSARQNGVGITLRNAAGDVLTRASRSMVRGDDVNRWIIQVYANASQLASRSAEMGGLDMNVIATEDPAKYETAKNEHVADLEERRREQLWQANNQFSAFADINLEKIADPDLVAWAVRNATADAGELLDFASMSPEECRAYLNRRRAGEEEMEPASAEPEPETDLPLDLEEFEEGEVAPAVEISEIPAPAGPPTGEDLIAPPEGGEIVPAQPKPAPAKSKAAPPEEEPEAEEDSEEAKAERARKWLGSSSKMPGAISSPRIHLIPDGRKGSDASTPGDHVMSFLREMQERKRSVSPASKKPEKPRKQARQEAFQGLDLASASRLILALRNARAASRSGRNLPEMRSFRGTPTIYFPPGEEELPEK